MKKARRTTHLAVARERMYQDLILKCAERVFAEHGFDGATMQAIAGEAGISLKTLYATFRGKEETFREIRKQRASEFLEHVARSAGGGAFMERLVRGVRAYVDFLLGHRDYFRIQIREAHGWGLDPANDSRDQWRSGLQVQAALVREGIAAGMFHDGDPELTAATAIAIMQVQLAGLVERAPALDTDAISREIVLQLMRYLCKAEAFPAAMRAVSEQIGAPQRDGRAVTAAESAPPPAARKH